MSALTIKQCRVISSLAVIRGGGAPVSISVISNESQVSHLGITPAPGLGEPLLDKKIRASFSTNVLFKTIHGLAPLYLSTQIAHPVPAYDLWFSSNTTLYRSKISCSLGRLNHFSLAAPYALNKLLCYVCDTDSLSSFKAWLKTHMFHEALGIVNIVWLQTYWLDIFSLYPRSVSPVLTLFRFLGSFIRLYAGARTCPMLHSLYNAIAQWWRYIYNKKITVLIQPGESLRGPSFKAVDMPRAGSLIPPI